MRAYVRACKCKFAFQDVRFDVFATSRVHISLSRRVLLPAPYNP